MGESETVIRVENVSKKYVIGHQSDDRPDSLRELLTAAPRRLARSLFGRTTGEGDKAQIAAREEFWALKDVSFEVKRGEVVGIIGRNGAGKSTLLKILSRITEPTSGRIEIDGRVASLLEVGTGFHGDLTGRENIYLNGSVLGMTRREINRKFDEIVAFAEVEKFLDTPVKRYSSGMYVRLAFAIAAHLEPEVLIVDEVLAVGDTSFQKKCLGKMGEVARGGRTVLFVSHTMPSVRRLCSSGVLLAKGQIEHVGPIGDVIDRYVQVLVDPTQPTGLGRLVCDDPALQLTNVELLRRGEASEYFAFGDTLEILVHLNVAEAIQASVEVVLRDKDEYPVAFFGTGVLLGQDFAFQPGNERVRISIPNLPLAEGLYYVDIAIGLTGVRFLEYRECCRAFTVDFSEPGQSGITYIQNGKGSIYVPFSCDSAAPLVSRW